MKKLIFKFIVARVDIHAVMCTIKVNSKSVLRVSFRYKRRYLTLKQFMNLNFKSICDSNLYNIALDLKYIEKQIVNSYDLQGVDICYSIAKNKNLLMGV